MRQYSDIKLNTTVWVSDHLHSFVTEFAFEPRLCNLKDLLLFALDVNKVEILVIA
jgi:hypothetical protein